MTREDAAHVLQEMNLSIHPGLLTDRGWPNVDANPEAATLDGEFTADQLEAIATWMRDPTIADIKA